MPPPKPMTELLAHQDEWRDAYQKNLTAPDPTTGCIEWAGTVMHTKRPYGWIRWRGRMWLAHRIAYGLVHGDLGPLLARHLCHNPRCTRVGDGHVVAGTRGDNYRDSYQAGHFGRARCAGLTEDDVRDIRRRVRSGESQSAVARALGMTSQNVSAICRRVTWQHVTDEVAA